ncbi:MAG: hypothetical protein V4726_05900 [Verrucomicrobiota bacterium]
MRKKCLRFLGRWTWRAVLLTGLFAAGWAAYAHFHPKPLLQDRWAALVRASDAKPRPGQGGKRGGMDSLINTGNGEDGRRTGKAVVFSMEDLMAMRDPVGQGLALVEALKTADAETCGKWLKILEKHPHRVIRMTAMGAVIERWTAMDPGGALAAMGDDEEKKGNVLRQWAHRDPAAALAAGDGKFHDQIRQGIMESDPDHAFSRWQEIAPGSPFPITLLEFALKSQVKKDPEGAMRQVPGDDEQQTNEIRGNLFGSWMDRDAEAALKYADGHADAKVRKQLLRDFAQRFPDRMEPVLATLEGGEKISLALAIAKGKAGQDPAAAARWLQSKVPAAEFAGALADFAKNQSGLTPEKLGEILTLCPDPAAKDRLLNETASMGWSQQTTKNWLKSQPPGSLSAQQQLLAFTVLPAAEAAALAPGGVTFPREEGLKMTQRQARSWNAGNPAELAANLSALPADFQSAAAGIFLNQPRWVVREGKSTSIVDKLPASGIDGIFSALTPAAQGETALSFAWKQQADPVAAARFLAASSAPPDDPAAAAVYGKIAQNWLAADTAAASAWIETLAPGAARDAAALALIQNQAVGDPAAATAWARTLQDPVAVQEARRLLDSTPSTP